MASDEGSAWYLHSQGRRFGPLNEDELRGYFRAGMVKSIDRISVPGQAAMLAAAEVAAMLGETAPVGPAAPMAASSPTAARSAGEAGALDERAANAIAQINMELASMAASGSSKRKSSGWMLPAVAGVFLVALLLVGLNMTRKMGGSGAPRASEAPDLAGDPVTMPGAAAVTAEAPAASGADAERWATESAQLTATSNWTALVEHSTLWTHAQPDNVDAWQALGLANSRLGKVDEAKAALDRVLEAQPENINARILLAEALLTAGRWTDAASAYKQLVAAQSQNPRHWNNYGVALGELGERAQAIAALETAVRLDPGFRDAWNNLGEAYQAAGDSGRATAAFAQANALR